MIQKIGKKAIGLVLLVLALASYKRDSRFSGSLLFLFR